MSHKPIQFKNVSLSFHQKLCFEDFNAQVLPGSRIAIIGSNGSGKSSLLKIIQGTIEPTSGTAHVPPDASIGYVPQIIEDFDVLSGAERLNKAISLALSIQPNVLLLDEPTNHLDRQNKRSLMRMLENYSGTLLIASHDEELLNCAIDTIWHIEGGRIHITSSLYEDYKREIRLKRAAIEEELLQIKQQKKEMHEALMKEQERASKSRSQGEKSINQKKWPTIVSRRKANRGAETAGRKKAGIAAKKEELLNRLSEISLPEVIKPKFSLEAHELRNLQLVSISDGAIGYGDRFILSEIYLSLSGCEKIAIIGVNGCGKSTLMKALLHDPAICKTGSFQLPNPSDIGYLDQHYRELVPHETVLESIGKLVSHLSHEEIRRHLRGFLFCKNEEVNAKVANLSGGEKARLSLAQIAAKTPKLLLLDEVTNNLDIETKEHVIQVLSEYPGAMIVISHDDDFLRAIKIDGSYEIRDSKLRPVTWK